MGLVAALVQTPSVGFTAILMSPVTMLKDPMVWLRTLSKHKVHISSGMDGLYGHTLKRLQQQGPCSLDLSCLRCLFSGGEMCLATTTSECLRHFSEHGLRPGAFVCGFGLAENGEWSRLCAEFAS